MSSKKIKSKQYMATAKTPIKINIILMHKLVVDIGKYILGLID
jgi:hypothetical protein